MFAVPKGGAIAHPDSYREVEQCSDSYRNENPCVPVPITIGTIPVDEKIDHTFRAYIYDADILLYNL
jgi:hypothetical protein